MFCHFNLFIKRRFFVNRYFSTIIEPIRLQNEITSLFSSNEAKVQLEHDILHLKDVISEKKESEILRFIDTQKTDIYQLNKFRIKSYESNHWDKAISKYKEVELGLQLWPDEIQKTLKSILTTIEEVCSHLEIDLAKIKVTGNDRKENNEVYSWLPPHIIDFAEDGEIFPHVDSVKHSDKIISGLSLGSERLMKLKAVTPGDTFEESSSLSADIELKLERRSLYILFNSSRFEKVHWIERDGSSQRRVSIMFRDEGIPFWAR